MNSQPTGEAEKFRSRPGRCTGFTLVETIIAFVILGIILLALTLVPIMSTRLMGDTVEREKAVLLAVGKLDEISGSFDAIPVSPDSLESKDSIYTIRWTSTVDPDSISKDVTVTVEWPGIMKQQSIEFMRQVAKVD